MPAKGADPLAARHAGINRKLCVAGVGGEISALSVWRTSSGTVRQTSPRAFLRHHDYRAVVKSVAIWSAENRLWASENLQERLSTSVVRGHSKNGQRTKRTSGRLRQLRQQRHVSIRQDQLFFESTGSRCSLLAGRGCPPGTAIVFPETRGRPWDLAALSKHRQAIPERGLSTADYSLATPLGALN